MTVSEWPAAAPSSRRAREEQRVRSAGRTARRGGATAIAAALAQIDAAFGNAAAVNDFKRRVEHILRRGPLDPAVRARFTARAALIRGRSLDAAIVTVERWFVAERKAFQIASALGCATRLSLDVLRELLLILRLARFKKLEADYHAAIAALCDGPAALAAE
jgi:hypothetical protein